MSRYAVSAAPLHALSDCFRLTDKGRACVDLVETHEQTLGSLSRYLHDVLMMCGSGMWFDQLRQFMPPRSLEESLRALMTLELIERVDEDEARPCVSPASRRTYSAFGQMARA